MAKIAAQKLLLETKLLYAAYRRKPIHNLTMTATTCFVGGMLWQVVPATAFGTWIGVLLLSQILGWIEYLAFKRARPGPQAIKLWQRVFLAQSAATSAAWSLGPAWLISQGVSSESAFFVAVLMSVAALAIVSASEQRWAVVVMLVITFLPPIIAFWSTGGEVDLRISLALICSMAVAVTVGILINASIRKILEAGMRIDSMLSTALIAVIGMDVHGQINHWSRQAEDVFGWSREEALGRSFESSIIPQQWLSADGRSLAQLLVDDGVEILYCKHELIAIRKGGEQFPIEMVLSEHDSSSGFDYSAFIADITERKQAAAAVEESEVRFRSLFEWVPDPLIVHQNGVVVYANVAAVRLFGVKSLQEVMGQKVTDWVHADFREDAIKRLADLGSVGATAPRIWRKILRADGTVFDAEVEAIAILFDHQPAILASIHDITERKRVQDEIQNLALQDPLTKLPNRRLLLDRLKHAVDLSTRSANYTALIFADLDKFKAINDHHGHDVGDLLLQEVAQRLSGCVRDVDTVARLGGDEFIVMLEALSDQLDGAATQAEVIGRKILLALNTPYQLKGITHRCSASIGVTLFTNFDGTPDELLKRADLAMYQAKAAGRNTLSFFDPRLQAELADRLVLEDDLRTAIAAEQFVLYYQAQVVEVTGVTGAEALVRWNHPQRGIIAPTEFIAVAEETGLILPLGNWILRTACVQLAAWAKRPAMAHLTLAVNFSANQLKQPNFVDAVLGILQETGANPNRLKVELTESQLVYNIDDVVAKMSLLKAAGVGFALDDFGTGYSSLSYLKQLPLDELKIDQGFVKHILSNPIDTAIATMMVALAKSLGLRVIAEGVETEAQRQYLIQLGCHAFQGFLLSQPLALEAFEQFVAGQVQPISAHTGA